jgi:signal transduction histidine kinase
VERSRLARDIHDGISQRLVSLSYHLDAALTHLDRADPGSARADIDTACGLVDTTLGEARAAIGALRPPVLDDLGLAGALAALARDLPGVATALALDDVELPDHVEIALYRIAQEALQNVVKHADADRVTVRLCADPHRVQLAVTDDGIGFTPSSTGRPPARDDGRFGLASVQERAELIGGAVRVASRPGEGTTVAVTAPLLAREKSSIGKESTPTP